jgi:hypothetical protein
MNAASNMAFETYSPVNPQPVLSVVDSTNGPLVTWPASAGVFALYTTTNLAVPAAWIPATNPSPVLLNGQWQLALQTNGSSNRFFRLQSR